MNWLTTTSRIRRIRGFEESQWGLLKNWPKCRVRLEIHQLCWFRFGHQEKHHQLFSDRQSSISFTICQDLSEREGFEANNLKVIKKLPPRRESTQRVHFAAVYALRHAMAPSRAKSYRTKNSKITKLTFEIFLTEPANDRSNWEEEQSREWAWRWGCAVEQVEEDLGVWGWEDGEGTPIKDQEIHGPPISEVPNSIANRASMSTPQYCHSYQKYRTCHPNQVWEEESIYEQHANKSPIILIVSLESSTWSK